MPILENYIHETLEGALQYSECHLDVWIQIECDVAVKRDENDILDVWTPVQQFTCVTWNNKK